MYTHSERVKLFWFVCVPLRICISVAAALLLDHVESVQLRRLVAAYLVVTGSVFIFSELLTCGGCKTAGGFGGPIWWRGLRYIHAPLWITTGVLVLSEVSFAPLILLADVLIGTIGACALQ